jgi:phenylpropionate dioxygenase-like ring-hydroxylating dioxygenase large terminal subunit
MPDDLGVRERPLTASQMAAVRSLPDNAAPEWKPAKWLIHRDEYLSPARYAAEQDKLFRRLPVPIAPSALLPQAGSYACAGGYGVPVLLTRDRDGVAHAFLNGCRHRGSKLVPEEGPQRGKLIVCPYHAWSYDMTGRLVAVPKEESFADLDKSTMGLAPLTCREVGGIIWVGLDRRREVNFDHLDAIRDDFDALGVRDMHLFAKRVHDVPANWKLIMDTFLEGYHVIRLHSKKLGDMFEDTVVHVERLGPNLRQTSGRLNFKRAMVDEHGHSAKSVRRIVTFVYNLLPNTAVIFSPDYVNLLVFMPQGPDRTRVENFMLTNTAPLTEKLQNKWERSLKLTDGAAFPEDFAAAALNQEGLAAGVSEHMTLGAMEEAIHHFHDSLNEYLAK